MKSTAPPWREGSEASTRQECPPAKEFEESRNARDSFPGHVSSSAEYHARPGTCNPDLTVSTPKRNLGRLLWPDPTCRSTECLSSKTNKISPVSSSTRSNEAVAPMP